MYNRILVPLDGSELSECALQHVRAIASGCNVPETVLFRVVEPFSAETIAVLAMARDDVLRKAELDNQAEARDYLARIRDSLTKDGLSVKAQITDGSPAEQILEYANNNGVDLIIMTTHGKTGVSRWFFGSVAQRVLQHSPVPVLMISPPGCRISP